MKSIVAISLFVCLTLTLKAQRSSLLYNEMRQLKADTNLVLTPEAYKVWLKVERSTLYHFIECYKPAPIFHENNVKTSCIFLLTIDSDSIEISIAKILELDDVARRFTKAVINPVRECINQNMSVVEEARYTKSRMVFYLPLAAPVDRIDKWVDENGIFNISIPKLSTQIME
jgi:hypothetical protein